MAILKLIKIYLSQQSFLGAILPYQNQSNLGYFDAKTKQFSYFLYMKFESKVTLPKRRFFCKEAYCDKIMQKIMIFFMCQH